MNNKLAYVALALFIALSSAFAIPPPRLPLPDPIHTEPNLLSDYERKTLTIELNKLTQEVRTARDTAKKDPSLDPYRKALADAEYEKDSEKIKDATRKLNNAVEVLLYQQKGMPGKIKRLLDVGNMLSYDSAAQKEARRRKGAVVEKNASGK